VNTVLFKDWLPDQPDLNNPGLLEALNVVPVGGMDAGYAAYAPMHGSGTTFNSTSTTTPIALLASTPTGATPNVYVGTFDGHLYQVSALGGSWIDLGTLSQPAQSLVQYNDLVFVAAGTAGLYYQTSGSSSTLNAVVGSPHGSVLGIIGQFLLTGNISTTPIVSPHLVGWSSIADPTDWPTPGSDSALASQAGEQFLHMELGGVTGIFGGDQWGVITQQNGITRVTYIGGADVFQFDTLSAGIGMDYKNCGVKIGNQIYFASSRGFYATDGVSLLPIGAEKVNRWFIFNVVDGGYLPTGRCGVDWANKIIYWTFFVPGASVIVLYNYETQRFTHAVDANAWIVVASNVASFDTLQLVSGITQDKRLGYFTGTPGTATFTTGEAEPNPGGYTFISGVKPTVDATVNAVVCSIGSRDDLSAGVFFETDVTVNARSSQSDFRVNARYLRARLKVNGTFQKAQGLQFTAGGSAGI